MHSWGYQTTWKRATDVIGASLLLLLSIIPMIIVALVIRMDTPGNPVFRQKRIGRNGREFTMWKFRTMYANRNEEFALFRDHDGVYRHKVRNDVRVTKVGRHLRRTGLDELPQLINVLMGHMSLVGPRPELPQIVSRYQRWQHQRHTVRPGITGWWQVSGKTSLPMHEHTEWDIYYINNVSPNLDAEIIRKTFSGFMRNFGARS